MKMAVKPIVKNKEKKEQKEQKEKGTYFKLLNGEILEGEIVEEKGDCFKIKTYTSVELERVEVSLVTIFKHAVAYYY